LAGGLEIVTEIKRRYLQDEGDDSNLSIPATMSASSGLHLIDRTRWLPGRLEET
jgi:hypothetical protein